MSLLDLSEVKADVAQAKVFKIEFGRCIDIVFAFNVVAKAFFYEKTLDVPLRITHGRAHNDTAVRLNLDGQ